MGLALHDTSKGKSSRMIDLHIKIPQFMDGQPLFSHDLALGNNRSDHLKKFIFLTIKDLVRNVMSYLRAKTSVAHLTVVSLLVEKQFERQG